MCSAIQTRRPLRAPTGRIERLPFHWVAHSWQDLAAATGIALIAASAASLTGAFRVQASHALDAYARYRPSQAQAQGGELRITSRSDDPNLPRRVQLYRDSVPDGVQSIVPGSGATAPIGGAGAAHIYQVRAALPGGAFALSNTLLAPSVLIVVDAQPWARDNPLARSTSAADDPNDAGCGSVAEGLYDLALENGSLTGSPLAQQIQVNIRAAGFSVHHARLRSRTDGESTEFD